VGQTPPDFRQGTTGGWLTGRLFSVMDEAIAPAAPPVNSVAAREEAALTGSGAGRRVLRRVLPWLAGLVLLAGAGWWWSRTVAPAATTLLFRTAQVRRGDVTQTVSATGPLSAVATVEVGSQVSGNIARLHADFNDVVRAGQLLAEIDPATFEARLVQAQADFRQASVSLDLRRLTLARARELYAQELVPLSEVDQADADVKQQEAMIDIKAAAVRSAQVDFDRSRILSPIDGVVIDRAVDPGQTVQASFAAPRLFRIAQDLREMQITANVSEADIGGVMPGQTVEFAVDAFPGQTFRGRVQQVRNNSTVTANVVTYPTIITVENPELKLRPGMTANLIITLARRTGVLRIPNAALRYRPPEGAPMTAEMPATGPLERVVYVVPGMTEAAARVEGPIEAVAVRIGLGDAAFTEVVSGLGEGSVVVTGAALPSGRADDTKVNPFVPRLPPHGSKR
jgi:HlyD family secretion protein